MKILSMVLFTGVVLFAQTARGQSPQFINYQAVARDAETGTELINQPVNVMFSILEGGPGGTLEYSEVHIVETNAFGLINLQIGSEEPEVGTFSDIDWSTGQKWLLVEMDLGEGQGFEEVSNAQLISVPYALHAETAETAVDIDDADADPTNELIDTLLLNGNTLQSYQGGFPDGALNEVNLGGLVDDADADPTNELIEEGSMELIDTLLVFTEGGITQEVNLIGLANFGPWQVGDGTVYNTEADIGIGTDEPIHQLQVMNQSGAEEDSVAVFGLSENSPGTNYALFGRASGGAESRAVYGDAPGVGNTRWAGYFDRGNVHISNFLGINNVDPEAQLQIEGLDQSTRLLQLQTSNSEPALVVEGNGLVGVQQSAPHSSLHVGGSMASQVRFEDAAIGSTSLDENDHILIVDVTDGPVEVTLPPASGIEGRIYCVKRTYTSATNNTLTIAPSGGDTIDSTAFPTLLSSTSAQEARTFISAGSNGWYVISE